LARLVFEGVRSGKTLKDAVGNVKVVGTNDLEGIVRQVIDANPDIVSRYQAGEIKLIGFLTGQVMKQAGGGADPSSVASLLNKLLTK